VLGNQRPRRLDLMPLSPLHWLGLLLIRNTRPAARVGLATPQRQLRINKEGLRSPAAEREPRGSSLRLPMVDRSLARLERIETFTTKQVEVNLAEDRDEPGDWRVEYFDPKDWRAEYFFDTKGGARYVDDLHRPAGGTTRPGLFRGPQERAARDHP
jgi:hypothetical protein